MTDQAGQPLPAPRPWQLLCLTAICALLLLLLFATSSAVLGAANGGATPTPLAARPAAAADQPPVQAPAGPRVPVAARLPTGPQPGPAAPPDTPAPRNAPASPNAPDADVWYLQDAMVKVVHNDATVREEALTKGTESVSAGHTGTITVSNGTASWRAQAELRFNYPVKLLPGEPVQLTASADATLASDGARPESRFVLWLYGPYFVDTGCSVSSYDSEYGTAPGGAELHADGGPCAFDAAIVDSWTNTYTFQQRLVAQFEEFNGSWVRGYVEIDVELTYGRCKNPAACPTIEGTVVTIDKDPADIKPLIGVPVTLLRHGVALARTITKPPAGQYILAKVPVTDSAVISVTLEHAAASPSTFQVITGTYPGGTKAYVATQPFTITAQPDPSLGSIVLYPNLSKPPLVERPPISHLTWRDLGLLYYHTHQAWQLANGVGQRLDLRLPVDVYAYSIEAGAFWAGPRTHGIDLGVDPYVSFDPAMSDAANNNRPDNREWHEFGHHVWADTFGNLFPDDIRNCPQPPAPGNDCNHWGYLNASTTDSWDEGLAEFYSMMVAREVVREPRPELYLWRGWEDNLEGNYQAWQIHARYFPTQTIPTEEFAVAGLLLDLVDPADADDATVMISTAGIPTTYADCVQMSFPDVWDVLSTDWDDTLVKSGAAPLDYGYLFDVRHLYDALKSRGIGSADSRGNGLSNLDELFIAHGFFADLQPPFRVYNAGEEVGSSGYLAFNLPSGRLIPSQPNRRSLPAIPGSFIAVQARDAESGAPMEISGFDVEVRYAPPFEHLSYAFQTGAAETPGRLFVHAPDPQYQSITLITARSYGHRSIQPLEVDSAFYWEQMSHGPIDTFMQHTFEMAQGPSIYLPLIMRGSAGAPAAGEELNAGAGENLLPANSPAAAPPRSADALADAHTPRPCVPEEPSPTATPTATRTSTPLGLPSSTVTPSGTPPATATATSTPSTGTPTSMGTPSSPTPTGTRTPTLTPSRTPTGILPTSTSTSTGTPPATATKTATATRTRTPTSTSTRTPTPSATPSPTATPVVQPTPSPTGGAPVCQACSWRDDFSAAPLDPTWRWEREDATHWSLSARPGDLRITTQTGDLFMDSNNARNLLLRPGPAGDFEITTRLEFSPSQPSQEAGLLVYQDDDNYVRLSRLYSSLFYTNLVGFTHEANGVPNTFWADTSLTSIYLKIAKSGEFYTGYFSADGVTWTKIEQFSMVNLTAPEVGIGAWNGSAAPEIPADFDWFCVNTSPGIHGRVTRSAQPATGLRLDLLLWDGADWLSQATTTTGADGYYCFTGVPELPPGGFYIVSYRNSSADPNPGPGSLSSWWGDLIMIYPAGAGLRGGDFDVADIPLVSPASGASVMLPFEFCWTPRGVPEDNYALAFYYPATGETAATDYLGGASCVTVTGLPPGWPSGGAYTWWVMVYQGNNPDATPYNYGASYYARQVTVGFSAR